MTPEFAELFTARLVELSRDLRSYHLPTKTMRPPWVFMTMLPLREGEWHEGEFFPHLSWCFLGGEIGLKPHPFRVLVSAGLRVDDETGALADRIRDGTERIMAVVEAMRGLCKNHVFGPYKLTLPFEFRVGDRESPLDDASEGGQPHPYYRARFILEFVPR